MACVMTLILLFRPCCNGRTTHFDDDDGYMMFQFYSDQLSTTISPLYSS